VRSIEIICSFEQLGASQTESFRLLSLLYNQNSHLDLSLLVHDGWAGLVVGEDERISDNDVLPPASSEDDDLGDVARCQRLAVTNMPGQQHFFLLGKSSQGEGEKARRGPAFQGK
jgi:hypothetical protein